MKARDFIFAGIGATLFTACYAYVEHQRDIKFAQDVQALVRDPAHFRPDAAPGTLGRELRGFALDDMHCVMEIFGDALRPTPKRVFCVSALDDMAPIAPK